MTLGGHWVVSGDICAPAVEWVGSGMLLGPPTVPRTPQESDRPARGVGLHFCLSDRALHARDLDQGPANLSAPGNIREGPLVWLQGRQSRGWGVGDGGVGSRRLCLHHPLHVPAPHAGSRADDHIPRAAAWPLPPPWQLAEGCPEPEPPLAMRETRHGTPPPCQSWGRSDTLIP